MSRYRRTAHGAVVLAAVALTLTLAPAALAKISPGAPLGAMVRNGTTTTQTEIIGNFPINKQTGGYVTRQSNTATGPNAGGGAIYGCRGAPGGSLAGSAPCMRASNVANGYAFEFAWNGPIGGAMFVGNPAVPNANAVPFITNATGVAQGLNADQVDSQSASQIAATPGPPNGDAGGALAGSYPNPSIALGTRGVAAASVVVASDGTVQSYFNRTGGSPTVVHSNNSGVYSITFPGASFNVSDNAAPSATLTGSGFGFVNASTSSGSVVVSTAGTNATPADAGFSLVVFGAGATG